jgi:hypothetical protein
MGSVQLFSDGADYLFGASIRARWDAGGFDAERGSSGRTRFFF